MDLNRKEYLSRDHKQNTHGSARRKISEYLFHTSRICSFTNHTPIARNDYELSEFMSGLANVHGTCVMRSHCNYLVVYFVWYGWSDNHPCMRYACTKYKIYMKYTPAAWILYDATFSLTHHSFSFYMIRCNSQITVYSKAPVPRHTPWIWTTWAEILIAWFGGQCHSKSLHSQPC